MEQEVANMIVYSREFIKIALIVSYRVLFIVKIFQGCG